MISQIITTIHIYIVMMLIFTPFVCKSNVSLKYHIVFGSILLFRWITNNHHCCITDIESKLTGKKEKGIVYRLVTPIYKVDKKSLKIILNNSMLLLIMVDLIRLDRGYYMELG